MDDKKGRTLWCGNLSDKITDDLLYELFLQAGPLECVTIPKDKDGRKRNYAFITFRHEESVKYTIALMSGISLYGRPLKLELRTGTEAEENPYIKALDSHHRSMSCPANMNSSHRHGMYAEDHYHGSGRGFNQRYEDDYGEWKKRRTGDDDNRTSGRSRGSDYGNSYDRDKYDRKERQRDIGRDSPRDYSRDRVNNINSPIYGNSSMYSSSGSSINYNNWGAPLQQMPTMLRPDQSSPYGHTSNLNLLRGVIGYPSFQQQWPGQH